MQEYWAVSDNKQSFEASMKERGYYAAKGDKRGHVPVDVFGDVYSLSRQLQVKKDDLGNRLGKPEDLPSVSEVKTEISGRLSDFFKNYSNELNLQHKRQFEPLLAHKQKQAASHRDERSKQDALQKSCQQQEEIKRSERAVLQEKIIELRGAQLEERQALVKEMSHLKGLEQSQSVDESEQFNERNKDQGFDWEPEI